VPPLDKLNTGNIKIPLQLHFGNKDSLMGFSDPKVTLVCLLLTQLVFFYFPSSPKTADALEQKLKDSKVNYEFFRYPNCEHAFTNVDRPALFDAEATRLAWQRLFVFLKKHL
jgi:carboxymethylenebutenolidase